MKEKLICIITPTGRTYYKALPLAKEFLDKDQNVINTSGALPDGEITEYTVSSETIKNLLNGKLNGKLEVKNLADGTISFSEEYKDGHLMQITERHPNKIFSKTVSKAEAHYLGTVLKSTKSSNSFYINGKEVAEETISSNGTSLEVLGVIPDGEVKEFDENGQIKTEAHYKNNKLNGEMRRYADNGDLLSRENYTDGFLNGTAEYFTYTKEGVVVANCSYKNAKLEGERMISIKGEKHCLVKESYQNGHLHGERETFYPNGELEIREQFVDGKLHGDREIYFPTGEIWYREIYSNGKLDGERLAYSTNGKVHLEEFYTDGLLEGTRRIFSETGELLVCEEYHWGSLVHNTERNHA